MFAQFDQPEVDPGTPCDHDDVERLPDRLAMLPEPLANPAFEPIALHGGPSFATDRDSEPAPRRFPSDRRPATRFRRMLHRGRDDDEFRGRTSTPTPEDTREITGIEQPIGATESQASRLLDPFQRAFSVRSSDLDRRSARSLRLARHAYFDEVLTASRFRPFALRALRTARPAFVFIRSRNPWVRRRLIRLGWNVRFMTADPHSLALGERRATHAGWRVPAPDPWVGRAGRTGITRPRPGYFDSSLGSAGAYPPGSARVNARPGPTGRAAYALAGSQNPAPGRSRVLLSRHKSTFCRSSKPPPVDPERS